MVRLIPPTPLPRRVTRCAPVVGALVGALLTIGVPIILLAIPAHAGRHTLELLWLCAVILLPAHRLSQLLGWAWEVNTDKSIFPPLAAMVWAVCVNTAIGYAVGAAIRSLVNKFKTRRTESNL